MLKHLDWSYLKEIFCEVSPWSESLNRLERATWLEVSGLPLHCWNSTTLKRLANLWGNFEALGENADHVLDCEKVSILITTNHAKRIEEVVEIELGNMVYEIGVFELGFWDSSTEIRSRKGVINNESCKVNKVSASVASTSSESMNEELEGDRSISAMEIETLNEMHPKEVCNYDQARESETQGCKIGELELMGGGLKETHQLAPENQGKPLGILEQSQEKEKDKEISFLVKNTSWAEVVQKDLEVEDVHLNWKQGPKDLIFPEEGWELHTLRTDEDERDMGFKVLQDITDSGSRKYMDLWAKAVDEKFNEGLSNAISDNCETVFWELNFSGGDFFMGHSQVTFVELIKLFLRGALIRFGVVFVLLPIQLMPLVQTPPSTVVVDFVVRLCFGKRRHRYLAAVEVAFVSIHCRRCRRVCVTVVFRRRVDVLAA
ncbi:hypothetical protein V6N13_016905 [Hibiscus sabdariffa]